MLKLTVELPESFEVVAAGKSVKVNVDNLKPAIVAQLALHGLRQKVADSAAGAKKLAEETNGDKGEIAHSLMKKVVAALEAGDWGTRQAASPVSSETKVQRTIVKGLWLAKATDEAKAKLKEMSASEAGEFLDALYAKQKPERQAAIGEMVAAELEAQKKRAKMLASLSVEGDDI